MSGASRAIWDKKVIAETSRIRKVIAGSSAIRKVITGAFRIRKVIKGASKIRKVIMIKECRISLQGPDNKRPTE